MSDNYNDRILEAQRQIESIIASGAPIAKLNIFDVLENYKPSERIINQVEYTIELYIELAQKLSQRSIEEQTIFLRTLKEADIIDNQSIEKEDSFLIIMHRNFEKKHAIDLLLERLYSDNNFSYEDFINIHDTLLTGTSSERKLGLRDNDLKFVGTYTTEPTTKFSYGDRAISYFPLKHSEISIAIQKLLNYLNENLKQNGKYKSILIPIACHGLIASFQLFKDGNTRYGRIIQSVLMYKLLNEELEPNLKLELPLVYASRQYAAFRSDYRAAVEKIVVNNDSEAWENWFNFNLKRIQDGIMYNSYCLETIQPHNHRQI